MSRFRPIERVFTGPSSHWVGNGFHVSQYFPRGQGREFFDRFSPFILLDYNAPRYFESTERMVGIGPHPHRGFETVTFAFAGKVEHGDNQGNHGVIEPGDVQWMTAGSGILHKEYHEKEYAKNGRVFHMIQLWVNLPAKDKMTDPRYQALLAEDMGKLELPDDGGEIIVYAGEVMGVKGPALTFSPMDIFKVTLNKEKEVTLNQPAEYNTGMLVIDGSFQLDEEKTIEAGDFVLFENLPGDILLKGESDQASAVFLSGEPLNEPVVAGGPFVMNTVEQLDQANNDYRNGLFGSHDF